MDVSKFGFDEPVVIKRLTIGDRCDIEDELKVGRLKSPKDLPTGTMKLLYLEKAILSAPFDKTRQAIRDMDPELADYLLEEIDQLNTPLEKAGSRETNS